jgi:hypothetical protein
LRRDLLGGDALAGQERRDLGAVGIDLGLDPVEVVAGRGIAQRPDREIGPYEGLGQPLDRDVVLIRAAALKTVADQPAGAQHAERDQQRHPLAVCSAAKKPVALAFEQIEEIVEQGIIEVVGHPKLPFGAAGPTWLAGVLRNKPRDRLAGQGDDDLFAQPHPLDQRGQIRLRVVGFDRDCHHPLLSDHVTQASATVNPHHSGQTTKVVGVAASTIRISGGRPIRQSSPKRYPPGRRIRVFSQRPPVLRPAVAPPATAPAFGL